SIQRYKAPPGRRTHGLPALPSEDVFESPPWNRGRPCTRTTARRAYDLCEREDRCEGDVDLDWFRAERRRGCVPCKRRQISPKLGRRPGRHQTPNPLTSLPRRFPTHLRRSKLTPRPGDRKSTRLNSS